MEEFASGQFLEADRLRAYAYVLDLLKQLPDWDKFNAGDVENYRYSAALVVFFSLWIDLRGNHAEANGALYVVVPATTAIVGSRGISESSHFELWKEEVRVEKRVFADLIRKMFDRPPNK